MKAIIGTAIGQLDTRYVNVTGDTMSGDLLVDTDSSYNLGTSSLYWANIYADKFYLNSTAILDGATAGLVKVDGNEIKSITKIPQENNEQSVTKKGLPITKEGVVTTKSGDGESPVDILTVEEIVNAHAIISKGMAEAEIVKDIKKGKK